MEEQLLETWRIHNRIHLYLLEAIAPEAMAGMVASKGRKTGEVFAHIHSVRLSWLKAATPQLLGELTALDKTACLDKEQVRQALTASGQAIEELLRSSFAAGGRVKGFKPHAVAFMGYLIAHEAHHRGEIGQIVNQAGYPLDKKTDFGMWEWGVR